MSSFTILVVEDEDAIRGMLMMVLEQAGLTPIQAADAEEAQKVLDESTPDLILLDGRCPESVGLNGPDA